MGLLLVSCYLVYPASKSSITIRHCFGVTFQFWISKLVSKNYFSVLEAIHLLLLVMFRRLPYTCSKFFSIPRLSVLYYWLLKCNFNLQTALYSFLSVFWLPPHFWSASALMVFQVLFPFALSIIYSFQFIQFPRSFPGTELLFL